MVLNPTEEGPTLGARRGQREERGLAPALGDRDPGAARGFLLAVPARSQEQDRGRPGSRARPPHPAGAQVRSGRVGWVSGRASPSAAQPRAPRPPSPPRAALPCLLSASPWRGTKPSGPNLSPELREKLEEPLRPATSAAVRAVPSRRDPARPRPTRARAAAEPRLPG